MLSGVGTEAELEHYLYLVPKILLFFHNNMKVPDTFSR